MASFCYDCTVEMLPQADPSQNDMVHAEGDEYLSDVCEGCGPGWFDRQGKRREDAPASPPLLSDKKPLPQDGSLWQWLRNWIKNRP